MWAVRDSCSPARVMKRNKGWKFHLLTEDLEFTMDSILHGDRIGYCGTAILYDEQPVTFSQSWRQRLRWSKGIPAGIPLLWLGIAETRGSRT